MDPSEIKALKKESTASTKKDAKMKRTNIIKGRSSATLEKLKSKNNASRFYDDSDSESIDSRASSCITEAQASNLQAAVHNKNLMIQKLMNVVTDLKGQIAEKGKSLNISYFIL